MPARKPINLREHILNVNDRVPEEMEIKEWGVTVYLRPLSAEERTKVVDYASKMRKKGDMTGVELQTFMMKLVVMGLCDAEGGRLFTEDDAAALATKHAGVLERIGVRIANMAGLNPEMREELRDRFREQQ